MLFHIAVEKFYQHLNYFAVYRFFMWYVDKNQDFSALKSTAFENEFWNVKKSVEKLWKTQYNTVVAGEFIICQVTSATNVYIVP